MESGWGSEGVGSGKSSGRSRKRRTSLEECDQVGKRHRDLLVLQDSRLESLDVEIVETKVDSRVSREGGWRW